MIYLYLVLGFLTAGAILTAAALVFPSSDLDRRNDR
jgi:hypothetical protein